MSYDVFISYSRKDNENGRVSDLKDKIKSDYYEFANEELNCFFDSDEIKGMEDWKHRLLQGLKESHILLLILSPNYLSSPYCEWEIIEYLKYEYSRALQGDGVAQIYFMEVPGIDSPNFKEKAAAWLEKVSRRQRIDLRPWYQEGSESLKRNDVKARLEELEHSLHSRILRMRRISNAIGNLPTPNSHFVGREREMKLLHESVGLGKYGTITALHGMGGLGKSTIALQYAYAYADFYIGGRWLIGCANETSLATALKKLDLDLNITFTEDEKEDDIRGAKRILNELEMLAIKSMENSEVKSIDKPNLLLLLDNVDNIELLQPPEINLISGKEWIKILCTTRMGSEEFGLDESKQNFLCIDELPFEDAVSLIENFQPSGRFKSENEKIKAGEIVKLLGCFTLAVEVAAIYLYESKGRISCSAFLELLKREGSVSGIDIAGAKTRTAINHSKLISTTLAPTLSILSQPELLTLSYAALLPPDSIPIPWLRAMVMEEYPELAKDAAPGLDDPWLSLINHLLSLRLMQIVDLENDGFNPRIVRMHRLVQDLVMKRNMPHKGNLVFYVWNRAIYLYNNWHKKIAKWEVNPLVMYVELLVERQTEGVEKLIDSICSWLPNISNGISLRLMKKQRAIAELVNTETLSEKIASLTTLGLIFSQRGEFSDAEIIFNQVISLYEGSSLENIFGHAVAKNNLARVYYKTGKLDQAIQQMNKGLEISDRAPDTIEKTKATLINNFAEMLLKKGDNSEAETLMLKALDIRKNIFGDNHPFIASSYKSLALLYKSIGRISEAEERITRAIPMFEEYHGESHFRVAEAFEIKSDILIQSQKYSEAINILKRVLDIRTKVLTENHPDTKKTKLSIEKLAKYLA